MPLMTARLTARGRPGPRYLGGLDSHFLISRHSGLGTRKELTFFSLNGIVTYLATGSSNEPIVHEIRHLVCIGPFPDRFSCMPLKSPDSVECATQERDPEIVTKCTTDLPDRLIIRAIGSASRRRTVPIPNGCTLRPGQAETRTLPRPVRSSAGVAQDSMAQPSKRWTRQAA